MAPPDLSLVQARERVALGEAVLCRQEFCLSRLRLAGVDTGFAEQLLANMSLTLITFRENLSFLERRLPPKDR